MSGMAPGQRIRHRTEAWVVVPDDRSYEEVEAELRAAGQPPLRRERHTDGRRLLLIETIHWKD